MEIKLRARLAAYTKIDSIESLTQRVPNAAIDTLFTQNDTFVSQGDIDELFKDDEQDIIVSKEDIDGLFETSESTTKVSYAQIDSLFD